VHDTAERQRQVGQEMMGADDLKVRLHKALSTIPEDQLSEEERGLKSSLRNVPEIAIPRKAWAS
jgi:hypothetical protein